MKNKLQRNIWLVLIATILMFTCNEAFAKLGTKVRICAVKGSVQTGTIVDNGPEDPSFYCPLKRTLNKTECRVITQQTMIETGPDGWATIEYQNGDIIKIQPDTKVVVQQNFIYVESGKSWFKIEKKNNGELFIKTPTAIAGIRGTEFLVNVEKDGSTKIQLIEGKLEVSDITQQSKMNLVAGMEVTIPASSSTLNTGLLNIQKNDEWWTDWPTLVPITEMPGNTNTGGTTSSNTTSSNTTGNMLSPIADSHVYAYSYSGWSKANWGKYYIISAGWNPTGGEKRAYLKFDISGIDKSTFEKASLKLFHYHTAGGNSAELGVYTVRNPWNEGNGNYKSANVAAPGEVCWISQPQSDQYPVAYFNPGTQTNDFVEVDITTLVKSWLEGMPNHGLAIKTGESYLNGPVSVYGFYAREHEDIDKRPSLIINSATNGTTNTTTEGILELPNIAGEWELTCIGDIIFKFDVKLVQSGNGFYGDMVQTNGSSPATKIEGEILTGNRIKFTRSVGNWKQYFTGEINQKSGIRATSFEGLFGFKDQLNHEWYAKAINPVNSSNINNSQGTARLLTVNSNQDIVGPNETLRENGKTDAIFRAQFKAPNRTVTAVEVSNTNGLRSVWDTRPNNGLWLGGVVIQNRIMSQSDGSVNFSLGSDQNTLDFFVEDNGAIKGGKTNYRMTIFFASGEPLIMDIVPANN